MADAGPIYHMAAHGKHVVHQFGNNDGSVFPLTLPAGDMFVNTFLQTQLRQIYTNTWGRR